MPPVSFLAIKINFIDKPVVFICKRKISLKRLLARLRLTLLPTFLLAMIVDENNSEGR